MKMLIVIFSFLQFGTPDYIIKNDYRYSAKDKRFIKNVVKMHGKESPSDITKHDGIITIEYTDTKYTLTPDGWMGETFIKEKGSSEWLSLGTEL
jgi:hypothetical protein